MVRLSVILRPRGQMSDALINVIFLTLSGGFQDAYTFFLRGGVFANAQTGNIVIMSGRLFQGDFSGAMGYVPPLLSFLLGVWVAERLRHSYANHGGLHWRQWVVLGEALVLMGVGFIPQTFNLLANTLVTFVCAMQVQSFRKLHGKVFASTMCIGNLRSAMEGIHTYQRTRDPSILRNVLEYAAVLLCFVAGAGLGSFLGPRLGVRSIWICCTWLMVSFGLMFVREPAGAAEPQNIVNSQRIICPGEPV